MKLAAINGSPRKEGNTWHALNIACNELEKLGIETEIINIGHHEIRGCSACGSCRSGDCVFDIQDWIKEAKEKIYSADAIIIGTPVYYSGPAGTLKAFLDRLFYQSKGKLKHKPCAAIAAVRRTGGMPALEQIHNYFLISQMIIVGSSYWNVIHGTAPRDILKDTEGVGTITMLARNIAWVMKLIENGKGSVETPEPLVKEFMNFIR